MYTYPHTLTRAYTHSCMLTLGCTHPPTSTHTHMCTHVHAHTLTHAHLPYECMHTHETHMHTFLQKHLLMNAYTHPQLDTCTHTGVHVCTHGPCFLEARLGAGLTMELQASKRAASRYQLLRCNTMEGHGVWALSPVRHKTQEA